MIEKFSSKPEITSKPENKVHESVSYEDMGLKTKEIEKGEMLFKVQEYAKSIFDKGTSDLSIDDLTQVLFSYLSEVEGDPSYLYDLSESDLSKIINQFVELENVKHEKISELSERTEAVRLSKMVDELKNSGKSNSEIIQQVLSVNNSGDLVLPPEKRTLYRNFLDLSTSQEYGSNTQEIKSIIDETPIDFDDPASFEIVLQKIYSDDRISENTKYKIEKQFGVPPIRNGAELRKAVTFRDKLRTDYLKAIGEIDIDLEGLNESIIELEKALAELQEAIELSETFDEQFELEDKRDELKQSYEKLVKQRLQLEWSKGEIEEKIPTQETVLLNGRITMIEGVFSLKMSDGDRFILPEGLGNNELADMANSYFIWKSMDSLGLAHTLFPEEDLDKNRLPSGSFMLFTNSLLSGFHMSHSGNILKLDELGYVQAILTVLRSENTLENKELSKEEGSRIDLNTLGVIEGDQVNYIRLNQVLEYISLSENPEHNLIIDQLSQREEGQ